MKKAKKSLGQNFLIDKNICNKIIKQTIIKNKKIIEIGPGKGFLTDLILQHNPNKMYLIEKDNELSSYLKKKYILFKNVIVINKDLLEVDNNIFKNTTIIGNLPYNVGTKIILYLIKNSTNINEMIFMIQKEVAIKFDYKIKKMNKYKFLTRIFCEYKRCFNVNPSVFIPRPKVKSTVVKFIFKERNDIYEKALNFCNIIFVNRRKKISNKFNFNGKIEKKLIDKRIDQISMNDLLKIYNFL